MNRMEVAAQLLRLADSVKTGGLSLRDTQDPLYRQRVKLRGYNGQPSVMSAHGKDAGDILIALQPDMTKSQHAQRSREFESLADRLQGLYDQALDDAAQDAWGRDFRVTDYRVSGIGSDEFSEAHKERLRTLAQSLSAAKTISSAHGYASKSRRIN
jgi:hypothetical protein